MDKIELHGQTVTLEAVDLIPELTIWLWETRIANDDQRNRYVRLRDALDHNIRQWDERES